MFPFKSILKRWINIENYFRDLVFLLAEYFVLGEGELFAELVLDDEGETEAEQQVGEREVEDEDVPSGPHGLVGDHRKQNHQVVYN